MVYMQPRANMSPIGRQPFRPGQWQGYKGVSKNTTYVQNNFFGPQAQQRTCCNNNGGDDKLGKWAFGLGIGATIAGAIASLFKKDKPQEAGGEQKVEVQSDNAPPQAEQPKVVKEAELLDIQEDPEVDVEPTKIETPDQFKDFGKNGLICKDASGKTQNIEGLAGAINITVAGAAGQPPKEFTITDASSGKPNTYTYKLTSTSADGKPVYTCTSKNGAKISKGNEYTYDGKDLVQVESQDGFGKGLKTDAQANSAPVNGKKQAFTQTVTIYTSVSRIKTKVTITANSQSELDKKVKDAEEQSKKFDTTQQNPNPSTVFNPFGNK